MQHRDENSSIIPLRVSFNFANKCNMQCAFCYVDFKGVKTDLERQKAVVDRLVELGAQMITFCGGDPFLYKTFPDLLEYTHSKGVVIQVDTNSLGLKHTKVEILKRTVNLVSLPLDGTEEVNTKMRGNPRHFNVVLGWLERLLSEGIPVKINTVVSKLNYENLDALAQVLLQYPAISRWSLYEFAPMEAGQKNVEIFKMDDGQYDATIQNLKTKYPNLPIESSGDFESRVGSYFLVTEDGVVQTSAHDPNGGFMHTDIGSIFEDGFPTKWQSHVGNPGVVEKFEDRSKLRLESAGVGADTVCAL